MGLFGKNINKYIEEFNAEQGIILIDVRETDEYASGRIPGSINVPLSNIKEIEDAVPDKSAKIYVYCLSGGRSDMAAEFMKSKGYTDVTNIGGIAQYKGMLEK
ncbi:MAG: rhodanese-like domain-containing protein [[Eubacterium] sulci]|nr:rhodanese-like domain-containing protein [[Eubacterium] sulci]